MGSPDFSEVEISMGTTNCGPHRQNERELQVAIKLCQQYVKQRIEVKDIVNLAGYIVQATLTKRALTKARKSRSRYYA